jgi:hypothetical protein
MTVLQQIRRHFARQQGNIGYLLASSTRAFLFRPILAVRAPMLSDFLMQHESLYIHAYLGGGFRGLLPRRDAL